MILSPYFWLGCLVALALSAATGARLALNYADGKHAKERVALLEQVAKAKAAQGDVTEKVRVEYRDRIKVVKEKGDEIEKLVPVYIHSGEFVPPGFRVLHDAAASGLLPESPERALAAAKPAETAAAAATVALNYTECRATGERLVALQKWAIAQHDVTKGNP